MPAPPPPGSPVADPVPLRFRATWARTRPASPATAARVTSSVGMSSGPTPGTGTGSRSAPVAHQVDVEAAQAVDEGRGGLDDPVGNGQPEGGLLGATGGEHLLGEQRLAHPHSLGEGHPALGQQLVHGPQRQGGGGADRLVPDRGPELELRQAGRPREAVQQLGPAGPRRRHGHDRDAVGLGRPVTADADQVLLAPEGPARLVEPGRVGPGTTGVHAGDVLRERPPATVLDRLLPQGEDAAVQVPGGDHDLDPGGPQRRHDPADLLRHHRAEVLHGDHRPPRGARRPGPPSAPRARRARRRRRPSGRP